MRLRLVFVSLIVLVGAEFNEHCRETLREAKKTVRRVAEEIAAHETARLAHVVASSRKVLEEHLNDDTDTDHSPQFLTFAQPNLDDDDNQCPQPNMTIFTKKTTTVVAPVGSTKQGPPSTSAPLEMSPSTTMEQPIDGSSTVPVPVVVTADPQLETARRFQSPTIFGSEGDPFAAYIDTLYYYLDREDHVCNNRLTDLNSITEDQMYGYFATLATSHPGPFCSLCHRFVDAVKEKVFAVPRFGLSNAEREMTKLIYAHIPDTKSICGAVAPACYENYDAQVRNLTQSVLCLECTACMSITNALQMKFLLQPKMVAKALPLIRGNIFHNLCAEICMKIHIPYEICLNYLTSRYDSIIAVATTVLRPERLCSLELQWCELNEAPNGIHCLKELCTEYFKETPQTKWLCSQIPDSPKEAQAFLNIKNKVSKGRKPYHDHFLNSYQHTEL